MTSAVSCDPVCGSQQETRRCELMLSVVSTSFALIVKECRGGGRGKNKTTINLLLLFFTSLSEFVQNVEGRPEVEQVAGPTLVETLTDLCPMFGVNFVCTLLTVAGQSHRPQWRKKKKNTSLCLLTRK